MYKFIKEILEKNNIDERIKPLILAYFVGKIKLSGLFDERTVEEEINRLCQEIRNVEFVDTDKLYVAYERKASILTINKNIFKKGKSEEIIPLIFAKFEEALYDRKNKNTNHIDDFINGVKIAQEEGLPISDEILTAFNILNYSYNDLKYSLNSISNDIDRFCITLNGNINEMVIKGSFYNNRILDAFSLFFYAVKNNLISDNNNIQRKAIILKELLNKLIEKIRNPENEILQGNINSWVDYFDSFDKDFAKKPNESYIGNNSELKEKLEEHVNNQSTLLSEGYIINTANQIIEGKPEFDSRISRILIPFLLRSSKIFDWNKDEFKERANQIDLTKDVIRIKSYENRRRFLKRDVVGGAPGNEINLDGSYFLNSKGELRYDSIQALFHELGHVTDKCSRESVTLREKISNNLNSVFYESINSCFEAVMMGNLYKDKNAFFIGKCGYEHTHNSLSIISAALGVSELDLVKEKDKGEEHFGEFLEAHAHVEDGKKLLNTINKYFLYIGEGEPKAKEDKKYNQQLVNDLYGFAINLMKNRIESEMKGSEVDDKYIQRQKYFLKKINENQKANQKANGMLFSGCKLIHNIGKIKDDIKPNQILEIAKEFIEEADFGFDNSELSQYFDGDFSGFQNPFGFFSVKKPIVFLPEGKDTIVTVTNRATEDYTGPYEEGK